MYLIISIINMLSKIAVLLTSAVMAEDKLVFEDNFDTFNLKNW